MSSPPALGEFEQVVLLAILRLEDRAYGVTIREEIRDCTDREPAREPFTPRWTGLKRRAWSHRAWEIPRPNAAGAPSVIFK